MTIATNTPASQSASTGMTRRGNSTVDCAGAQVRAYLHHLATVVAIRGEIDAVNVDQVTEYIQRFTLGTNPVVLDMSQVSHFTAAGISLLCQCDADCRTADVEWTLVASPAIGEQLGASRETFPIARSVHRALRNLADATASRRQLVLPLVTKTA